MKVMEDCVSIARQYADDPMWANHAEVPKRLLMVLADEIERLRETNKRLNRRCQQYESAIAEKWTMGGGLGRALANAAAAMYKAENERLKAEIEVLRHD